MARDRYLWNAGEESIHQPGAEAAPKTPKSKWQNFWYYHKWHMLAAFLVAALVIGFTHDLLSKKEPDYQIALLTQTEYPQAFSAALEKQLAQYGEDLNGDGQVLVRVNPYLIVMEDGKEVSNPTLQMTSVAKFLSDLELGDSMIYLTDEASFQQHQATRQLFSNLDGTTPSAGNTDYDAMRVPWQSCRVLSTLITEEQLTDLNDENRQLTLQQAQQLSASMRRIEGTELQKDEKKVEYYTACKKLFDKLVYDK